MASFKVKGKVVYQSLGTGVWGILDENEKKWQLIDMPSELKKEGVALEATLDNASSGVSLFMWGTPVKLISFQIL